EEGRPEEADWREPGRWGRAGAYLRHAGDETQASGPGRQNRMGPLHWRATANPRMGPLRMIKPFWLSPGDLCLGESIIPAVYRELPEFREGGTLEDVAKRMLEATEGVSRCELLAVHDGQLIGFACVAEDDDMH